MAEVRYPQIRDELEKKIRRRELTGRLPGVIRLAAEYGAGQATIKRAVQELIDRGLLTVDGTRGTFIAESRPAKTRHGVIGLVGQAFAELQADAMLDRLNRLSAKQGYTVMQLTGLGTLARTRPLALAQLPCDGFLTFGLTSELAAAIRQSGKKLVALNACFGIPGVSWADFDWASQVGEALRAMHAVGHRRIAFAMWDNPRYGFRNRMFEVYQKTATELGVYLTDYFFAGLDEGVLYAQHGSRAAEVAGRLLADYFCGLPARPTAAYLHMNLSVVSALRRELAARGVADFLAVGMDRIPASQESAEPYLRMDHYDLVRGGLDLLLRQFQGAEGGGEHYLSPVRLVGKIPAQSLRKRSAK